MNKEEIKFNYCLQDNIGFVALIQHIGTDLGIVNAARVSFGKKKAKLDVKDTKLIDYLFEHNHGSPFEHNSLTFHVKAPIFVARQWFRHRIASYNEISGRYVELKEEFYVPREFREQSENNRQASKSSSSLNHKSLAEVFAESCKQSFKAYQDLLASGVAREQARAVLPLSLYTEFYFTCNLRAFLHFVELRNHPGAQWEIKQYSLSMLSEVKKVFPETIKIVQQYQNKLV